MTDNFIYSEYAGYRCLCNREKRTSDLYLTYCGMEQCSPTHFWGPGSRPEYHIHFVLNGEGYLEIHNKKIHLQKGQIFLLPANVNVYYYADHHHPWYYAWAAFNGEKAKQYLEEAGFSENSISRNCILPPEEYASIIHQMLLANDLTPKDEFIRIGYLYHLFSLLIRSNIEITSQVSSPELAIKHALQYIEYNYNNDIQISSIAEYVGLNRTYFTNLFKRTMNISPKNYLSKLRMEKACKLLATTNDTVADIAQKVGYQDPFVFSKMFSKTIGISPSAFRQKNL